jgi:tetratricopeptide (TPR) repeat protein
MRIKLFYFFLIVNFCLSCNVYSQEVSLEQYDSLKKENETLRNDRDNLLTRLKETVGEPVENCDTLKRDYENVKRDRDNLIIQMNKLRKYKVSLTYKDDVIKGLEDKMAKLSRENDHRVIKLAREKEELVDKNRDLEVKAESLEAERLGFLDKGEDLEKYIEKMEIEYRIVGDLKTELKRSEVELGRLQSQRDRLAQQLKKSESDKISAKAEINIYRRQIRGLKKQYTESLKTNKNIEKKLQEVPKKFAEIARENKVLLKETALMHYNLGVFYIEESQHRRAIAELEKAIELNPDDAYAHFNLGYIYAEYLVNRPRAIDNFRQYLKLATKEDTEIDWVKRYILTWQAWEGQGELK